MSVAQFHEHLLGGGVLAGLGLLGLAVELQMVEEDFAHLCGRGGVERLAGQFMALTLQFVNLCGEVHRVVVEGLHIDACAGYFHSGKHLDEGKFYVGEQVCLLVVGEGLVKGCWQVEGDVGEFAHQVAEFVGGHLVQFLLATAFWAEHRLWVDGLVVQHFQCNHGGGVATLGLQQVVRHRGVVVLCLEVDAGIVQHHHVALHIVADDAHLLVLEERTHHIGHPAESVERQIVGGIAFAGESKAQDLRRHRLVAHRHDVHCHRGRLHEAFYHLGGLVEVGHHLIVVAVCLERGGFRLGSWSSRGLVEVEERGLLCHAACCRNGFHGGRSGYAFEAYVALGMVDDASGERLEFQLVEHRA